MPLFYFDLPSDWDDMGVDLPDVSAARAYALRYASELIRDLDVASDDRERWRMSVRGADDTALFALMVELGPVSEEARMSDEERAGARRQVG